MKHLRLVIPLLAMLALAACSNSTQQPLIVPPVPELNPAFVQHQIDARQGGTLHYSSGTTLTVPPDALVNAQGQPIKGQVAIEYRELHNGVDAYLSGIPMSVQNSEGKQQHFRTAVMWQIEASQNGQEVFIDPNKPIKATTASFKNNSADENYGLYYLDETKGEWGYLQASQADSNQQKLAIQNQLDSLQQAGDKLKLNDCFVFNYMRDIDVYNIPKDGLFNYFYGHKTENEEKRFARKLQRKIEGYGAQWTNNLVYYYHKGAVRNESWDWKKYEYYVNYSGRKYPISMVLWQSNKPLPSWVKTQHGNSVALDNTAPNTYRMRVTNKSKTRKFTAYISMRMPLRHLYRYSADEWNNNYDHIQAQIQEDNERMQTMGDVVRSFEVREFGIYNYDVFLKENDGLMVHADFMFDQPVEDLSSIEVVVLLDDRDGFIKYSPQQWRYFGISPSKRPTIFALLPGKKLAVYPYDDYAKIDFDGLNRQSEPWFTFKLKTLPAAINNADDMLKAIEDYQMQYTNPNPVLSLNK